MEFGVVHTTPYNEEYGAYEAYIYVETSRGYAARISTGYLDDVTTAVYIMEDILGDFGIDLYSISETTLEDLAAEEEM